MKPLRARRGDRTRAARRLGRARGALARRRAKWSWRDAQRGRAARRRSRAARSTACCRSPRWRAAPTSSCSRRRSGDGLTVRQLLREAKLAQRAQVALRAAGERRSAGGRAKAIGLCHHRRRQREGAARRHAAGAPAARAVVYVGSHPMAGSHQPRHVARARGPVRGRRLHRHRGRLTRRGRAVVAFWEALGARVVRRDRRTARRRGRLGEPSARTCSPSRSRGALAAAPPARRPSSPAPGSGTSPGSRAATPELWADILTANRKALAAPLAPRGAQLEAIARAARGRRRREVGPATRRGPIRAVLGAAGDPDHRNRSAVARTRGDRSKGDPDQGL